MAIQIVELREIEARGGSANGIDVEPLYRLFGRDDLVVAMAPAEAEKIVSKSLGQVAQFAIRVDAERAMPLRQFRPVGSMDQRHMGEFGNRPAERVIDLLLAKGIVEVVVAADHISNAHVV